MSHLKNLLASVVGVSLVAACSAIDIEKTRALPSEGTTFQKALHVEYAQLAFEEDYEGDSDNAVFFDKKAHAAAQGKEVQPENTKAHKLPKNKVAELEAARIELVAALGSGAREKAPEHAAHAQAMFDCWMEEQEEDIQPKDIARCRSAFDKALAAAKREMVPAPVAAKPPPKKVVPPRDYVLYFGTDSAKFDAIAEAVMKQAVADYKSRKKAKVYVAGHTDTVGNNDYNKILSDKRADAVSIRLVGMGVSGKIIKKARYGETSPAVATGDNKNERKNRRVSIRVSD